MVAAVWVDVGKLLTEVFRTLRAAWAMAGVQCVAAPVPVESVEFEKKLPWKPPVPPFAPADRL